MSAGKLTRQEFLYEIIDLKRTHSINLDQVLLLYSMMYKIEWTRTAEDLIMLFQKGLVKPGYVVDVDKLYSGKKTNEQLLLDFNFSTEPKGTEETLKLSENLKKTFVPDKFQTEEYIKLTADEYFKGDIGIAEHFITFKFLFPKPNASGDNTKWNSHFEFSYEDSSRWDDSMVVVHKFRDVYKKKDIGYFLSGLYYFIRDAIDFEQGRCFATKPNKFLDSHNSWYELAKEKHIESLKRSNKPKRSL